MHPMSVAAAIRAARQRSGRHGDFCAGFIGDRRTVSLMRICSTLFFPLRPAGDTTFVGAPTAFILGRWLSNKRELTIERGQQEFLQRKRRCDLRPPPGARESTVC